MKGIGDARFLGMAGEHRVASELLLKGHNPSISIIDKGIDIILENGKSIQVKTTSQLAHHGRSVALDISSTAYTRTRNKTNPTDLRADYFIVWIIPRNEFYIIPKEAIVARNVSNCISITPDSNKRFALYKDRWDLLE